MGNYMVMGRSGPLGRDLTWVQANDLAALSGGTICEPPGHRGHPTDAECARASTVSERLGVALRCLCDSGFSEADARAFLAGVAWEIGQRDGETWHNPRSTKFTIDGLLNGRAAKMWSLLMIERAIEQIQEVL